jgi:pimeloyl-ACP methyl ester carboxylesterase
VPARAHHVETNGLRLRVVEAGEAGAPVVLLLHGFPETSHSWRHQLAPLADAGYHVLAPDLRGYGGSDAPDKVEAYGNDAVLGDLLGLLDHVGAEDATFVGHDWGALLTWDVCHLHPSRVRAAVAVSVPLFKPSLPPTEFFERVVGDGFFYILYFQAVGVAEAELGRDTRRTMRAVLRSAPTRGSVPPRPMLPREGTGLLDALPEPPDQLPSWLPVADLDVYVDAFERSGFFGPVSYYRNMDANWRRVQAALATESLPMPTFFLGGDDDPVIVGGMPMVDAAHAALPDHRASVLIPGVGHWVQQEAPELTTATLLGFLQMAGVQGIIA